MADVRRIRRRGSVLTPLSILTLVTSVLLYVAGCPANTCFLEICEGSNCRCSISSCTEGAEFDTNQNRCRCVRGTFDVAGQCLTQRQANSYCGIGYGWFVVNGRGGCAKLGCRPGDQLDERTGLCIPNQQVAQQAGVQLGQGQKLGCNAGEVLVVNDGQSACVPAASTCAKDEVWTGTYCQKSATCGTGETFDPTLGRCVPYASAGSSGVTVDVQQWAYSTYGPQNGTGTPSFCGSFAKKPLSFGVGPGGSVMVRVVVGLTFGGGEVARGQAQTNAVYESSGAPVMPAGATEVQSAAASFLSPLVLGGGRASAETATTTVRCLVANGSKPVIVPDEIGGF
ncbi:MAG: hypothetical protein HOW73_01540 [Polyangiaceae bacterium]|nr:hypothetical protein [Polyangiaceae bacterium]